MTMTAILASNGVTTLGKTLRLTDKQIAKAQSSALALAGNPNLKDCDNMSKVKYCYETARFNFVREDAVYPIPYGGKIQAQISYQGFRELAMRTGKFSKIDCVEVKDCDEITTNDEGEPVVIFEKNYLARKECARIGFYGFAKDTHGNLVKSIYMTDLELQKHGKRYSKSYNKLWAIPEEFAKMAKKTIIKQLCKDLDISEELDYATKTDQMVFGKENEANSYEDNPQNKDIINFDFTDEPVKEKTTVKNTLADKVNLHEDDMPIPPTPTPKKAEKKEEPEQQSLDEFF